MVLGRPLSFYLILDNIISMFAIIATGGKQYKVTEGATIKVDRISSSKDGEKVVFDKVFLIDDGKNTKIGAPYIRGGKVEARLVKEGRGRKIVIQKFKAKSNYRKKLGFRPYYSEVTIEKISS